MKELAKIFMLTKGDSLTVMEENVYDSEDVLQEFLVNYPELLAGDQISPEEPRRWLLIRREMGVPEERDVSDRWSLDHLFVDQEGIPTLVECKRSSDTRTRRQVVGQMLDYAANASEYWPIDRLRQSAAETAAKAGKDVDATILAFLGEEDPEALERFWESVERNLRAGRIRLLFVSDNIPRELRRIVEFLNIQMERTEVLAVEVKQFTGAGSTVLAPRVHGVTEEARQTKQAGRRPYQRRTLTEEAYWKLLKENAEEDYDVARKLIDEYRTRPGIKIEPAGTSLGVKYDIHNSRHLVSLFSIYTDGRLGVWPEVIARQISGAGLNSTLADEYGDRAREIMRMPKSRKDYYCPIESVDIKQFTHAVDEFLRALESHVREE